MAWAFINLNSQKALDVPSGAPVEGHGLQQFTFHQGQNQLWDLVPISPDGLGRFKIRSVKTQLFLTVPDDSTEEARQVVQQSDVGSRSQVWMLQLVGMAPVGMVVTGVAENYYFIFFIINENSALALDVDHSRTDDNAPILQYHPYGGKNQLWMLQQF